MSLYRVFSCVVGRRCLLWPLAGREQKAGALNNSNTKLWLLAVVWMLRSVFFPMLASRWKLSLANALTETLWDTEQRMQQYSCKSPDQKLRDYKSVCYFKPQNVWQFVIYAAILSSLSIHPFRQLERSKICHESLGSWLFSAWNNVHAKVTFWGGNFASLQSQL